MVKAKVSNLKSTAHISVTAKLVPNLAELLEFWPTRSPKVQINQPVAFKIQIVNLIKKSCIITEICALVLLRLLWYVVMFLTASWKLKVLRTTICCSAWLFCCRAFSSFVCFCLILLYFAKFWYNLIYCDIFLYFWLE